MISAERLERRAQHYEQLAAHHTEISEAGLAPFANASAATSFSVVAIVLRELALMEAGVDPDEERSAA